MAKLCPDLGMIRRRIEWRKGRPEGRSLPARARRSLLIAVFLAPCVPAPATAQYALEAANGDTVMFESAELRVMLDTARALYKDLQEDPGVLYYTPLGRERVPESDPSASYPWNVVTVISDSVADLQRLPADLREADRAYYNYAVQRMRVVRGADPDVPCDSVLALEEKVVGSFIDGWILSRTLFGGPAFDTLDELVFARHELLLRPLLARRNDRQVGACAAQWADENPERVAAYDAWRREHFPQPGEAEAAEPDDEAAEEEAVEAEAVPDPESGQAEGDGSS